MILILDNFDSFTYNLVDCFNQLEIECIVKRNDTQVKELVELKINGLVLSPGPGIPSTSGNLMKVLKWYSDKLPILGICLGHQAIGEFFGNQLVKAHKPMHGKISKINHANHPLFQGIPNHFNAVRYNSLILAKVKNPLIEIAKSNQNENMVICHETLPIYGVQFHPEAALTEYGLRLLENWLSISKIVASN